MSFAKTESEASVQSMLKILAASRKTTNGNRTAKLNEEMRTLLSAKERGSISQDFYDKWWDHHIEPAIEQDDSDWLNREATRWEQSGSKLDFLAWLTEDYSRTRGTTPEAVDSVVGRMARLVAELPQETADGKPVQAIEPKQEQRKPMAVSPGKMSIEETMADAYDKLNHAG